MTTAEDRIRELHQKERDPWTDGDVCGHCAGLCHSRSGLMCEDDGAWPCDTIRALDGA